MRLFQLGKRTCIGTPNTCYILHMKVDEHQLREFIADSGLVSRKDIEEAQEEAEKTGKPIGEVLVSKGSLEENDLRRMTAYVLGIPFVDLKDKKIDPEVLSLIPEPIARTSNVVPYARDENAVEIAMLDTKDLAAIDSVRKKVGLKVKVRLTDDESIKSALVQYQKSLKEEFGDIISKETKSLKVIKEDGEEKSEAELKKIAEDLPVVRIVETLLKHAIIQKASDIHIEPSEHEVMVRYRVDGLLHDAMTLPKEAGPSIAARIKVLASLKLDEKRLPQDGRFKMDSDGEKVSFRVSTLPTYYGEKVVMRLLREGAGGYTLETLGFHGENLERIHEATRQKTGLILVTGPTGSGKTTTLYTILDILNQPDVNISTIEDPIEYQMPRVNQTQVNPQIGLTFEAGLRSLVRQDPDIIMVGEIRDGETASLAINAALTGHLVLATLHTNSAAGAIPRLLDMGAERFLLSSTLRVIVGQRLVRQLCDKKDDYQINKAARDEIAREDHFDAAFAALKEEKLIKPKDTLDDLTFYRPVKSPECEDGYSGRIGMHEVLRMSEGLRDLMMQDANTDGLEAHARKEGMLTMLEDGIYKAARGVTSLEEVLRVISE